MEMCSKCKFQAVAIHFGNVHCVGESIVVGGWVVDEGVEGSGAITKARGPVSWRFNDASAENQFVQFGF
jgi:hypothetical protein